MEEGGSETASDEEEMHVEQNFFNLLLVKLLSFHEARSKAVR